MRVNRIVSETYAEGPGLRYCIWVQGCSQHCEGCFAKALWDYNGGYEISYDEIISDIQKKSNSIRGITLLGGEPFDKAEELLLIAKYAKSLSLDVIAFTGYLYDDILKNPVQNMLLKYVDLLIDGKFDISKQDFSRPLVGSSNQRFIFLTEKISEAEINNYKNRFEIRTDKNGKILFNGMGNINKIEKLIKNFKE